MPHVFVTDAQNRKTLAVIRSLGKKGILVTAGEETAFATSHFSKYCHDFVVYPSPRKDPELFYKFLLDHLKRNYYDVFFPMDDDAILVSAKHKQEISQYVRVPIADFVTLMKARNKVQTIKIAMKCGVPCPQTYFIHNLEEIKCLRNRIDYPVIIKPQESSGSRGIVIVNSKDDLLSQYQKIHQRYPFPLIQEMIPVKGEKYQVSALFDHYSEPKAVFVQKILRQYPVNKGADTFSESVCNRKIERLGIKLLKAMNWYGVAGVEFIVDPRDGIPKLMEVNPRFWASLQLAIFSGVDFPFLLYKMAVDGSIEEIRNYKIGKKYRWLLPGDILSFLADFHRLERRPSFFNFSLNHDITYAILSRYDPGPTIGFAIATFRYLFSKEMWARTVKRI